MFFSSETFVIIELDNMFPVKVAWIYFLVRTRVVGKYKLFGHASADTTLESIVDNQINTITCISWRQQITKGDLVIQRTSIILQKFIL